MTSKQFLEPLDRIAIALMLVLSLLIGILVWSGDRTLPRVRNFGWQDKQVGAEDNSFILTFSRPMEQASVEANLQIEPLLPGKISWAGRRMAYTLLQPVPYGIKYKVQLSGATDRVTNVGGKQNGKLIEQFIGKFSSRDRAFAYVGVEKAEQGRLILYNLTQQEKSILTPPNLVVTDFKPYPASDRIVFSAIPKSNQRKGLVEQQLYTVTTGINYQSPEPPETESNRSGKVELILDNKNYQNVKFDLSPDGQTIVVQRVSRRNSEEFGLWVVQPNAEPKPLGNQPGGDFVIAPDSTTVAIAQGLGVAILPLKPQANPLDFLPKFGMVLSFAKDGTAATMVKFNPDYTRSLFLVTNQGVQKELLRTNGSIIDAKFDPASTTLFCLLTQLLKGEQDRELPYLVAIDLKTAKLTPLLELPEQRDIQMSMSPDGLALLFDRVVTTTVPPKGESLTTSDGQAIASSSLWILPLTPDTPESTAGLQLEQLPIPGFHPRWLP